MGKAKGVVDIVFLMDATESMQKCIDKLKENIKMFIAAMLGTAERPTVIRHWRAKVVGFRDYEADGKRWLEDNAFTSDVNDLYLQLDELKAEGGGDVPESLLDAIYKVGMMEETALEESFSPVMWRPRGQAARIMVAFTDASFHEPMTIPEANGGTVDDVINLIHSRRLLLSVYAPRYDAESRLIQSDYIRLTAADRAEYIPLIDGAGNDISLDEFTEDAENFQDTLLQLARTITETAVVETL